MRPWLGSAFLAALALLEACAPASVPTVPIEGPFGSLAFGRTEVTQGLFAALMGENPSHLQGDLLPVDSVTWHQAVSFCDRLSLRDGLQPCYGEDEVVDRSATGWRLPSEEEWLFAARGSSDPDQAWYANSSEGLTHPVGTRLPTAAGIFDLAGNVWEWSDNGDPAALQSDLGGGYRSNSTLLGPSGRGTQGPGSFGDDLGFRLVRRQR